MYVLLKANCNFNPIQEKMNDYKRLWNRNYFSLSWMWDKANIRRTKLKSLCVNIAGYIISCAMKKKHVRNISMLIAICIGASARKTTMLNVCSLDTRCASLSFSLGNMLCRYNMYISDQCVSIIIKIRNKAQLINSLVVEHYVGPPYVIRRHVQHLNSSILLRLPSQFVVVPWLETANTTNINTLLTRFCVLLHQVFIIIIIIACHILFIVTRRIYRRIIDINKIIHSFIKILICHVFRNYHVQHWYLIQSFFD